MKEITVYVDVVSPVESATYGDTTIVVGKDDPYRSGFLRSCELYFTEEGQPDLASQFHQAAKQTPWDDTDDGS